MTSEEILRRILSHNVDDIIPKMAIGLDISFAPTITNHNWKIAYVRINTPEHITTILTLLNTHFQDSYPQIIHHTSLPSLLTSIPTLDTSPPANQHINVPTNCRVKQCPLYNMGIEETIDNNDLPTFFNNQENHGLGIHNDLLNRTPLETLESIGWFQCCFDCSSLHFGDTSINTHRETCPAFLASINPPPPTPPPTITDDSEMADTSNITKATSTHELTHALLFDSCPRQHHTELQTLIDNNTPQASINAQIIKWISAILAPTTSEYTNDSNE